METEDAEADWYRMEGVDIGELRAQSVVLNSLTLGSAVREVRMRELLNEYSKALYRTPSQETFQEFQEEPVVEYPPSYESFRKVFINRKNNVYNPQPRIVSKLAKEKFESSYKNWKTTANRKFGTSFEQHERVEEISSDSDSDLSTKNEETTKKRPCEVVTIPLETDSSDWDTEEEEDSKAHVWTGTATGIFGNRWRKVEVKTVEKANPRPKQLIYYHSNRKEVKTTVESGCEFATENKMQIEIRETEDLNETECKTKKKTEYLNECKRNTEGEVLKETECKTNKKTEDEPKMECKKNKESVHVKETKTNKKTEDEPKRKKESLVSPGVSPDLLDAILQSLEMDRAVEEHTKAPSEHTKAPVRHTKAPDEQVQRRMSVAVYKPVKPILLATPKATKKRRETTRENK